MSPKKLITMRVEPELKAALDATLDAEEKVSGRVGGVSMLFRNLAALYLRQPLPIAGWQAEEQPDEENPSLDSIEAQLINLEAQVWGEQKRLKKAQAKIARSLLESVENITFPLMQSEPTMEQHHGMVLIGRLRMILKFR